MPAYNILGDRYKPKPIESPEPPNFWHPRGQQSKPLMSPQEMAMIFADIEQAHPELTFFEQQFPARQEIIDD